MLALIDHDFTKARESVQDGVDNNSLPAMVARIYADLPLKKDTEAQELSDKVESWLLGAPTYSSLPPWRSRTLSTRTARLSGC